MNQRCKGQGMIFSIITANKEKTFVQRLVKSIYWLLLKREKIPTKSSINRKLDFGMRLPLLAPTLRKTTFWKGKFRVQNDKQRKNREFLQYSPLTSSRIILRSLTYQFAVFRRFLWNPRKQALGFLRKTSNQGNTPTRQDPQADTWS